MLDLVRMSQSRSRPKQRLYIFLITKEISAPFLKQPCCGSITHLSVAKARKALIQLDSACQIRTASASSSIVLSGTAYVWGGAVTLPSSGEILKCRAGQHSFQARSVLPSVGRSLNSAAGRPVSVSRYGRGEVAPRLSRAAISV